jgi:hypothetical protein
MLRPAAACATWNAGPWLAGGKQVRVMDLLHFPGAWSKGGE